MNIQIYLERLNINEIIIWFLVLEFAVHSFFSNSLCLIKLSSGPCPSGSVPIIAHDARLPHWTGSSQWAVMLALPSWSSLSLHCLAQAWLPIRPPCKLGQPQKFPAKNTPLLMATTGRLNSHEGQSRGPDESHVTPTPRDAFGSVWQTSAALQPAPPRSRHLCSQLPASPAGETRCLRAQAAPSLPGYFSWSESHPRNVPALREEECSFLRLLTL